GLRRQCFALDVLHGADAGVCRHDDLEVLRVERGNVANLLVRLLERRVAPDRVGGRDGIAESDLGLVSLDGPHVGDTGAGKRLTLQVRYRLLPDILELSTKRYPASALRAGHETDLVRLSRPAGQGECHAHR